MEPLLKVTNQNYKILIHYPLDNLTKSKVLPQKKELTKWMPDYEPQPNHANIVILLKTLTFRN